MTMPLPVNTDSSYADSGTDASVKAHQQHHDTLHDAANQAAWNSLVAEPINQNYYGGGMATTSLGTFVIVANRLYFAPLVFSRNVTIDRIGVSVTTAGAAGTLARFGMYDTTATGAPGTLLLDAGTVATDAAGGVEIAVSLAVPAFKRVWIAGVYNGTPTIRNNLSTGMTAGSNQSTLTGNAYTGYHYVTHTFAALPATSGSGAAGAAAGCGPARVRVTV